MKRHGLALLLLAALLIGTVTASMAQQAVKPQPEGMPPEMTPEEKAFLDQVQELRQQLRITQLELALLEAKEAPEAQIAEKAEAVYRLEGRLYALHAKNRQMAQGLERERPRGARRHGPGVGGGRGMGPGMGPGMGRGRGRGMGRGMEEGFGPQGQGLGRGMGRHRGHPMEPGMGRGMGRRMGRGEGRYMGPHEGMAPQGQCPGRSMGLGRGHGRGMRMGLGMMRRPAIGTQQEEAPPMPPEAAGQAEEKDGN